MQFKLVLFFAIFTMLFSALIEWQLKKARAKKRTANKNQQIGQPQKLHSVLSLLLTQAQTASANEEESWPTLRLKERLRIRWSAFKPSPTWDRQAEPWAGSSGVAIAHQVTAQFQSRFSTLKKWKAQKIDILFEDMRAEQLRQMSLDETVLSEEQKRANRYFDLMTFSVVSAMIGRIVYPPILLLMMPPSFLLSIPFYQEAIHDLFVKRRVTTVVSGAVTSLFAMAYAPFNPPVIAIGFMSGWVYAYTNKIIVKAKDGTRKHLTNLMGEQPKTVWVVRDGVEVEISFVDLQMDDLLVVDAGQMILVDGVVVQGEATIDQRMLTGEAQPAEKGVGDPVLAATIVLAGKIVIQVQKTGQETTAAQIGTMLVETADFTSNMELRGKEIADRAALPTLLLGAAALPFVGVSRCLSILISGVGFNMRTIGPLSVLNYLQRAAQEGILIKDGRALEQIGKVDTIVFDKTGTLTLEQPHVAMIHPLHGYDEETVLAYAAAAEQRQSHPIAQAILQAAHERNLQISGIDDAAYEVGYGIQVSLAGKLVRIGSRRFMKMENISIPHEVEQSAHAAYEQGHSLVYVAVDNHLAGTIELQSTLRPEAKEVIQQLREHGLELYIISGDHERPTRALAEEVGIEHYFAETLPEHKAEHIARLQQEGKFVCFVGDGINDAIALKQAQVSISIRGATTIATDTAQMILMDQTLNQLPKLFAVSEEFERNMEKNLLTTIIPGGLIIFGAFAGMIGYGTSIIVASGGMAAGMFNAMLPRLTVPHPENSAELENRL